MTSAAPDERRLTIAIVGLGYWGPNLLRNAWEIPGLRLKWICDLDELALEKQVRRYPGIEVTTEFQTVLDDREVDAVILATPIKTHHQLAKRCLLAGKHVLVEKPLAATVAECDELTALANERDRILMPGHTFLYSPPVVAVKDLIASGELGDLYFGTMSRVNLGIHQRENNVIRDLAPHDFSILLFWFGEPRFVRAIGRETIVPGSLDVGFLDLGYDSGALVHVELSWLAPTKLRRTVLVGSGKMVVYEDTSSEQVRIYDRGVDHVEPHSFGEHQLAYRSGDVITPRIDVNEPLRLELEDFAHSIRHGTQPRSSMHLGTRVVRMIEAAELSLEYNGAPVPVPAGDNGRALPDRRRSSRGMPVVPSSAPLDPAPPLDPLVPLP